MSASIEPGDRAGTWIVRLDGMDQSCVDVEDPTRLHFDYVRRLGDLLDGAGAAGTPLRVLHVGGAGMTLARYVAATRPGSRQVVLEPDTDLVDLVRERVPLPRRSGISVRPVDGRAGLRELRDRWADAVVVDAFASAQVPEDLLTVEAWLDLIRVTGAGGLVVLNLVDRAPFAQARDVVAALREAGVLEPMVGVETATLRGRRPGNLLLVAAGRAPTGPSSRDYRWLPPSTVASTLGGGSARHDVAR